MKERSRWDDAVLGVKEQGTDYAIPALILLVLIGTVLRFYNLDISALWLDEAFTLRFSVVSYGQIWENVIAGEFNPPLFYWMEHIMISLFGDSEIVLRTLPVVFGILAIPVFYLIGKEFKDEYTGIVMAAMCTFSPFLIWYSQEARTYPLLLLLVAGATYYYFKGFQTGELKDWSLFAVLGALAFWSHFYALVIIGSMFLFAGIWSAVQKDLKPVLVSFCIYILVSLPILVMVIPLFLKRTVTAPTYGYQGTTLIYEIFKNFAGFSDLMLPIFLFLLLLGIIAAVRGGGWKGVFLIWIFIVTFLFSYMVSATIPMLPKYLIFMTIFFFLSIALCYEYLAAYLPKGKDPVYAVLWMSVFFGLMSIPFA
ncbi:MAG: glycosyltransferase family 39 protein, partial [Methanoregula sp.]|nr:glycosyltransferase family 39 protein [Methanoregula sp.]